jgi:predicted RNase H-like HicB family nuclease
MSTSAKSKGSAKAGKAPGAEYVRKAEELAERYKLSLWMEDGRWYGRCVELPNCLGGGDTADACVRSVRQAIVAGLAADLADGLPAPAPSRGGARTEQVNVRLSADEAAIIAANAERFGFKGMADYIRSVALVGFRPGTAA